MIKTSNSDTTRYDVLINTDTLNYKEKKMNKRKIIASILIIILILIPLLPAETFSCASTNVYIRTNTYVLSDKAKIKKFICDNIKQTYHPARKKIPFEFRGEGKFLIKYVTSKNKNKKRCIYVDWTKPTISGVKNNNVYEGGVGILITDNVSGIASVTLNGKKVQKRITITEAGTYKLVAKDKSKNKAVVKFSVTETKMLETPYVSPTNQSVDVKNELPTLTPTIIETPNATPVLTETPNTETPAVVTSEPDNSTVVPTEAPPTSTEVAPTPTPIPNHLAELVKNWSYTLDKDNHTLTLNNYIGTSEDVIVRGKYYIDGIETTAKLKYPSTVPTHNPFGYQYYGPLTNITNIKPVTFTDGYVADNAHYTFYHCTNLEKVYGFEGTFTEMYGTFEGCTKLNQKFSIPPEVKTLAYTFFNCKSLEELPSFSKSSQCTSLDSAFRGCENLTNASDFKFPTNVTYINKVFQDCAKLDIDTIEIPSTVKGASHAFYNCKLLKNVQIGSPYSSTNIGAIDFMLYGCDSLETVCINGEQLKNIKSAIRECSNTAKVELYSVSPDNIEYDEYSFTNCTLLIHAVSSRDKEKWQNIANTWAAHQCSYAIS